MADETVKTELLELATELTTAWLADPNTRAEATDVPGFLSSMNATLSNLTAPTVSQEVAPPASEFTPAVTARRSLASKDHINSMIDGKPDKTLKRHLSTNGLTPQEYRERYGLKADYPMVAENYAEMRRSMAKRIGLGRKAGEKVAKPGAKVAKPKTARRSKVAAAPVA